MAGTTRGRQERPLDLPLGFGDAWLLDCAPIRDCKICQANWKQLKAAKDKGDIAKAARHATEIRDHSGGHR